MSEAVEYGTKAAADAAREEYSQYVCPEDDDKRLKTVHYVSDVPAGVMDTIEAEALESTAEDRQRSEMSGPLGEGTRERIKELGGFEGNNTTFSWRSAKGVFTREGIPESRFNEMLSTLADYDDPVEGAESEIARLRKADAERGTTSLSGDGSVGEEDILADQQAADQARNVQALQSDQCNHAEDECRSGDPEACEFLQNVCGLPEEQVEVLLSPPEDPGAGELPEPEDGIDAVDVDRLAGLAEGPIDPGGRVETALADNDTAGAIEGAALGALKRSWSGYQAGVSNAEDALDQLREQWEYAQQAANAINSVRDAHGQDPLHFDRLEAFNADLSDFVRKVARDCEECHADHSEHDHDTDAGDTEDMQQAVLSGFSDTPVGTSEATETAAPEFAPDLNLGMEPIDPNDRQDEAVRSAYPTDQLPLPDTVGDYTKKRGLETRPGELGSATYTGNGEVVRVHPVRTGNGWWATRNDTVGEATAKGDRLNRTQRGGSDLDTAIDAALGYMQENSDTAPDLDLDTETLDPRGRIENATTDAGDPDISDLPNGFEFAGTEEYGDNMTFYNWVAPSRLPGEETESISIRETREDFTIYAGPGDDRNLMNSGFEDFAAAYDAAAELADGMGAARSRPAGGRTDPGDVGDPDDETPTPDRMAGLRETGALNPNRRIETATNDATGREFDASTISSVTGIAYPSASDVADTFRGWAEWADHIEAVLVNPDSDLDGYGSTGRFDGLGTGAKSRLSKQMDRTAARRVLLEAGRPASVEVYENAGKIPVGSTPDPGAGDVIEADPQQSLGGGRANDQARLAGGERGSTETEIESTAPENPGGLDADRREDTTDAPTTDNTEQQVPDAFAVPEGGQDSLTDF
jgi:hypothetical protein